MAARTPGVRVPVHLMRNCGMYPERGVNVALYQDRVLIRGNECGGSYRQNQVSKQLILGTTGISPAVVAGNFAIVEGPDYLVLTTREDALQLGAGVPVTTRQTPHRVDKVDLPVCATPVDSDSVDVLAWKDVNVGHSVRDRASRVANVSGHLWGKAGFIAGDSLRFTKHPNATVVEKCAPAEQHSTLYGPAPRRIPRHYFGAALIDLRDVASVRVIATPGKLIVTRPDSDIAARCTDATHQAAPARLIPAPQLPEPGVPLVALDTSAIIALKTKCYPVSKGRLTVTGAIWAKAGFAALSPAKLVHFENALVVEACDEATMDFRIGTPSQQHPYRNLGLAGTGLSGLAEVQVVAAAGRLILTRTGVEFGQVPSIVHAESQPAPLRPIDCTAPMVLQAKLYPLQSGVVSLRELACLPAGLDVGHPVRVTHYADAVLVEACAEADRTARVMRKSGKAHIYVNLEATVLADELRVQVQTAPGRIALVKPTRGPLGTYVVQVRSDEATAPLAAPVHDGALSGVLKARRCRVKARRIALRGSLMEAAGFVVDEPVRVVRYADALVLVSCAKADMDGLVRNENGGKPVVSVALAGSTLENETQVLALAARGRIVLARTDNAPDADAGTPVPAAIEPEVPAPAPMAEICRYHVPAGKRLQMQGRWLNQFGFDAGAKYEVRSVDGKVFVELGGAATSTVTAHSATTAKLYVSAASLVALAGKEVQVRARQGLLELAGV